MEFNNYCIIVMGNTDGIIPEIEKTSEELLGNLYAKGIVITTFVSGLTTSELNNYFKSHNRNFVLFKLSEENAGYNFLKPEIQSELFGKIAIKDLIKLNEELSNQLPINEIDLSSLTKDEIQKRINDIIDKGVDNLSDYDKNILEQLVKLS